MSLIKRGRVYWTYFYMDGVRHQHSTKTGSRTLALRVEAKLKEEAVIRRFRLSDFRPEMTFRELADEFLSNATVRPHHLSSLRMLLPFFGETAIGGIDKGLANQYRAFRHQQKTLTETTINRDIAVLRRIFYWAVDDAHLLPASPLARIRLARERKKWRPVLAAEQEKRLLLSASPHVRPIIITALDTGMRRGEVLNQAWKDVDLVRGLLYVTRSKTPEGESREIPLTARVLRELSELSRQQGSVFTFQGHPVQSIKTAWSGALKRAGIPRLRFHDLRHTFATRLMEAGVAREVRKALLGHSSGNDVHDGYVHVELPLKRKAIAILEQWREQQVTHNYGGQHDAEERDQAPESAGAGNPEDLAQENAS
jgi:integrase